jgi:hypothetical protein
VLSLNQLVVTQNRLRNTSQLERMKEFAWRCGRFTHDALLAYAVARGIKVSPLIHIARIVDDGSLLVHDGHHRTVAVWRGGRRFLDPEEYIIAEYTYQQYIDVNFDRGWYTPFDPRTECRLPDFKEFKESVRRLHYLNMPNVAGSYVRARPQAYKEARRITTIEQLSESG